MAVQEAPVVIIAPELQHDVLERIAEPEEAHAAISPVPEPRQEAVVTAVQDRAPLEVADTVLHHREVQEVLDIVVLAPAQEAMDEVQEVDLGVTEEVPEAASGVQVVVDLLAEDVLQEDEVAVAETNSKLNNE